MLGLFRGRSERAARHAAHAVWRVCRDRSLPAGCADRGQPGRRVWRLSRAWSAGVSRRQPMEWFGAYLSLAPSSDQLGQPRRLCVRQLGELSRARPGHGKKPATSAVRGLGFLVRSSGRRGVVMRTRRLVEPLADGGIGFPDQLGSDTELRPDFYCRIMKPRTMSSYPLGTVSGRHHRGPAGE
jgi:hypothetical protein